MKRPQLRKRLKNLSFLPTMLTLGNGACGMTAIAIAFSPYEGWTLETKLFIAGCLIFAGMLFDAFDGWAARATGQTSDFGGELDSLCDAITFGAAPAVLLWQYSNSLPMRVVVPIGVVFTLCVLLRLARFNVETGDAAEDHAWFDGLPSPAAAGTIATFTIATPELAGLQDPSIYETTTVNLAASTMTACQYVLPALTLMLAYLMVSRFKYEHFVARWLSGNWTPYQIGQTLFVILAVVMARELALPLVFCYFAFSSPVQSLLRQGRDQVVHD